MRRREGFRPTVVLPIAVVGPCLAALVVLIGAAWRLEGRATPPPPTAYPDDFGVVRLMIDPGHGGENTGTRTFWFRREKDRNLEFALALKERLESTGRWAVQLTREADVDLPNPRRPEIANEAGVDLYISLHSNGHLKAREGFGVIWYLAQNNPASEALAMSVARAMAEAGFTPDRSMGPRFIEPRGPDRSPEYQLTDDALPVYVRERVDHRMIWPATMPAVLIETHYMTNPLEGVRFSFARTRERLAAAIENGLAAYAIAARSAPTP